MLKLRPGITGPATLKYRLEDEMIAEFVGNQRNHGATELRSYGLSQSEIDGMTDQELAVWYNDHVIYPDKVRLNKYYLDHYSFIKDIQMIVCTVLGKKIRYAGEEI